MKPYVISLTTIPPRFSKIGPTLKDLVSQRTKPVEIRLNLTKEYRRFPGELPSLPDLPEGITVHWCDTDYGPATKVLPTVLDYQDTDHEILFCDDDQKYGPTWAEEFLKTREEQPNKVIAGKGYDLIQRPLGYRYNRVHTRFPRAQIRQKRVGYRAMRVATMTLYKPRPYVADGHIDIMEGFRGVLVRPSFFPKEVFDIPDILWTVDDPWLSGHFERNNVPIWLMTNVPLPAHPYRAHFSDRLGKYVYKDHGRLKADTASIDYFRETYGIWPGEKEDPANAPDATWAQFFGAPIPFHSSENQDTTIKTGAE